MTNSSSRKRRRKRYRVFRAKEKVYNCQGCDKPLNSELHHAYCNECWKDRKNKGLKTELIKR